MQSAAEVEVVAESLEEVGAMAKSEGWRRWSALYVGVDDVRAEGVYICTGLVVRVSLFCLQITRSMILGRTVTHSHRNFPVLPSLKPKTNTREI